MTRNVGGWMVGGLVVAALLAGCALPGIGNRVVDGRMRFVVVEASGGG